LIPQACKPEAHQIDHWLALKHGGQTSRENLALACALCNNYKGPDLATIDPVSGAKVFLFDPRTEDWRRHFELVGAQIVGLTAMGRATVQLLRLNSAERVAERELLIAGGTYPPPHMQ
jgi:hypothetical protein